MLRRYNLIIAMFIGLTACAARGVLEFAPSTTSGTLHKIWVANHRAIAPPSQGQRSPPRPKETAFEHLTVSVPMTHQPGQIEWPEGLPDAASDFVTVSSDIVGNASDFSEQIARSDRSGQNEVVIFVHGYNVTHGEAIYQLTQIKHDLEIPTPTVLFSWPSIAKIAGYLYDRDSVLIARDALEDVILTLAHKPNQTVVLAGHSMGALLLMETLRQIEISGSLDIGSKIGGLFLFSPDIDGELFGTQASRMETLPDPFVIMVARQDRALRIFALLTGRTNRLGSVTNRSAVGDLPISVIDFSELSMGGFEHNIALTSPSAIAILLRLRQVNLPSDPGEETLITISDLAR